MVTTGILPFRENSHGRTGNRTRDLMISSQRLWPLDHEAGLNKLMWKPASSPWRKHALTRLVEHGVGGQLTSKRRSRPPVLAWDNGIEPVWTGQTLPHKQECSGTVSWWLHPLPLPWECYAGSRNCTSMVQPFVTNANFENTAQN